MPTFTGTAGPDTLTGTTDADTLISNGGSDTITASDGDDTVIVISQLTGYGTLNGGNGTDTLQLDRAIAPVNAIGGAGGYALNLAVMNNVTTTILTSFERLVFNSQAGDQMSLLMLYGGNNSAANQIGTGLSATAEIVGGAGQDLLNLTFNSANLPGTMTAPSFTFTNWDTPTRAYLGDRVTISVAGSGATTLNGSAHVGVQGLNGGGGSDIINGSNDMDLISGGAGGSDQLFGNGGDDTLFVINSFTVSPSTGIPGAESARTGAGSLFDGGSGFDFLMLGGNVNFQGTIQNIEGLVLLPGYFNSNAGATIVVGSQNPTVATFSSATFAALPTNLLLAGQGHAIINLGAAGETFNGSAFQFDALSDITFEIVGGAGNDTMTGTSSVDLFHATGGTDTVSGLAGDDTIRINAAGQASNIAGGADFDTLIVLENTTLTGSVTGMEAINLNGVQLIMSSATFNTGFTPDVMISGSGALIVGMTAGTTFNGQDVFMNTGSVSVSVVGSAGTDVIKGVTNAVNFISGNDSNDQIRGGAMFDVINGGNGNDKIIGFTGADTLTGGAGADQFRYLFASDSTVGARDHITDFLAGTDKFNFTLLDADPVAAGRQALTFIDTLAFSAAGSAQLRYAVSGADLLVQVDLDGNGTADMEIVLDGAAAQTLTGGDFLL